MKDSKAYSRVLERSEDVITSTQLYGIFNPKNLHSFQGTLALFLPLACAVCNQTIYPVVDAATCVRCGLYSHRKCVSKQRDCKLFTFKPTPRDAPLATSFTIRRAPFPTVSQMDDDFVSAFVTKLDNFVEKACMIPTVLNYMPEPGSQYCIWKSILRAVALNQTSLPEQSLPLDTSLPSNEQQQQLLLTALSSSSSFPGQVAYVCTYAFTSLHFDSVDTLLQHARECLDTVVCAILSVTSDALSADRHAVECLATLVDRFMLQQHENVIYVKIMTEIQRSTRVKLGATNPERIRTRYFPKNWRAKCVVYATRIARAYAPTDKLQFLVRLMQYLSKLANRLEKKQEEEEEGKKEREEEHSARRRSGSEQEGGSGGGEEELNEKKSAKKMGRDGSERKEEHGDEEHEHEERGETTSDCSREGSSQGGSPTAGRVDRIPSKAERDTTELSQRSGSTRSFESEESVLEPADSSGWITYNRNVAALWETVTTDDDLEGLAHSSSHGGGSERRGEREGELGEDDVVIVERPKKVADTDQLLQVCAFVVYIQQRERVVDWIAECRYLSSEMTNRDSPVMSGPQGYALATLQQTLYYLVQGDGELFG